MGSSCLVWVIWDLFLLGYKSRWTQKNRNTSYPGMSHCYYLVTGRKRYHH